MCDSYVYDFWSEQGGERIIGYVPHGSAMEACLSYLISPLREHSQSLREFSKSHREHSNSQGTLKVRNDFRMFWVV